MQEHHSILSNLGTSSSSTSAQGLNPRKRKATSDNAEFIFNVNDQYGSEFENPDVTLDGAENAPSEFDTDILSDFVRVNLKIATA